MGAQRFQLAGGGYATVPDDQLDYFYAEMEGEGFTAAPPDAEMSVGEPQTIKTEQPSMMQRFLGPGSAIDNFGNSAPVRGLAKGLSFGGSDELGAAMNAATGGDYEGSAMRNRFLDDKAANEEPIKFGAGRGAGMLPGMLAKVPAMAYQGVTGALARIGMGGAQGVLGGAGESNSDDLGKTIDDAGIGGLIGGGLSALGEAGGAALQWGGDKLRGLGVGQRRASAGGSVPEYNAVRERDGIDAMESGLNQRFDELGLAKGWKPQSASDVYRRINPEGGPGMLQDAGQKMGGAMDAAGEAGAYGDWGNVRQGINEQAAGKLTAPIPSDPSIAAAERLRGIGNKIPVRNQDALIEPPEPPPLPQSAGPAQRPAAMYRPPPAGMQKPPPPPAPPIPDLPPAVPGLEDGTSSLLRGKMGRQVDRLNEPLDVPAPDPYSRPSARYQPPHTGRAAPPRPGAAPPPPAEDPYMFADDLVEEVPDGFNPNAVSPRDLHTQKMEFERAGKYPEGTVATATEALEPTAYREASGPVRGELNDVMREAGPEFQVPFNEGNADFRDLSTFGAMAGKKADQNMATNPMRSPWTYGSSVAGAAAGGLAGGPLGAIGGAALGGGLGQRYGQDVAGMAMMGTGNAMRGAGGMAKAGAQASRQGVPFGSENDSTDAAGGRGYLLSEAAIDMLQSDPQLLGQYAQGFADAYADPEPSALSTMIIKLSRTDENFRTQILPALRARTQGGF